MNANPTSSRAEKIRALILETLPPGVAAEPEGVLFGPGGRLDSLELVNFLADLEFRLAAEFGRELVLASDRAMSRGRSPFRDVNSLAEYIGELLAG